MDNEGDFKIWKGFNLYVQGLIAQKSCYNLLVPGEMQENLKKVIWSLKNRCRRNPELNRSTGSKRSKIYFIFHTELVKTAGESKSSR